MVDTNITALRNLYVALGGSADVVAELNTIPELINKISIVAGAGASELPAVKKADAGKVLMVNSNGKWAVGEIPTNNG